MKNISKAVIIALAAVIVFSMAGCENPTGTGGDKVLTGDITISAAGGSFTINTELTANYTGTEDVDYQWKKNNTAITGATTTKYTPTEAGSYTVTVSAPGYESKTSKAVEVTNPLLTLSGTITISPNTDVEIDTELTATYSGTETVTFQWHKDGDNVGTNSDKYTPTEAGSYSVTVSATGYHSKTSAVVDVSDPDLPTLSGDITISPSVDVTINTELTATYTGTETVTYRWNKDGIAVGTDSNKYTPTEPGDYTVTVSAENYNPKTSAPVTVNAAASGDITYTVAQTGGVDGKRTAPALYLPLARQLTAWT